MDSVGNGWDFPMANSMRNKIVDMHAPLLAGVLL
jgi:hypothetical protein